MGRGGQGVKKNDMVANIEKGERSRKECFSRIGL